MNALRRVIRATVLYLFLLGVVHNPMYAQTVDVGGLAYLDYYYTLSSPNEAAEDLHGFTYRRLYLTTDFRLSDDFAGRARLEAHEGTTGSSGPVPFVKDLYVTWRYSGEHSATLGVGPPPAFEISEAVWGYRSLEKTILDLQGIVSSRDFGIRFDGPITSGGGLRYAAMLANNEGVRAEDDSYKRAYAEIAAFPTEHLRFTVGADRAGHDGPLETSTRLSAFAGYVAEAFRAGLEGFWSSRTFENGDELTARGLSLFGAARLAPHWELLGRVDRAAAEIPGDEDMTTFLVVGVAYSPNAFVRLIPNMWMYGFDDASDDEILGRFTVEVRF